jgi:hypothetical protein
MERKVIYKDIFDNLKKLSYVKEYDKLIILDNTFEIDNRYFKSITRMFYNNSRADTSIFIKNLLNDCIEYSNKLIVMINQEPHNHKNNKEILKLLIQDLIGAELGLINLKTTYKNDIVFENNMDLSLKIIRILIYNIKNFNKTII